ncbi:membrane protein insertase YidC [Cellulomonas shaoxiangyii]|uniref:Membrane protein insertase YidC n=1 Tax=Cellulomonas shaoxiangyii TaxID=2566013 RepID=A0A4P7SM63_9CELL|nr:membrane protein insertase YidC [Cellulomonas shaoxiangyii]QCB95061.1 membrane protein insertase YidC [Cellulomonas shaoxiangyii]TGY86390.1 membrane protein insertase YidC [Cellulomonas shaoxiangyii]
MDWMDGLLFPIMVAVAWIMVQFHDLLTAVGLDPASGAAWALSIVGLVIVIRILLIPLFFKQIKASRGMQLVQPEMQALQKKYKGRTDPASREAQSREMMELYRRHGTNPFASCLPLLLQSPIFFALFRVLYELPRLAQGEYPRADSIGPMTRELAGQAEAATIWGAPLSGTFMQADGNVNIMIVTVLLIVAMSVTTFTTQRQLTMKNMPPAALQGPMAQQQKILLYVLPLVFAFSGVNFPIGVLLYWTTTNLWSMGQQFYTIRRMPAPGSQAEAALKERKARKAARRGASIEEDRGGPVGVIEEKPRTGQRQQPKRKDRAKSKPVGGAPAAPTTAATPTAPDAPTRDVTDPAPGGSTRPAGGKGAGTGAAPGKARPKGSKGGGARPGGATRAPGSSSGSGATDGSDAS